MIKKVLTATSAFELLIQCACDATELRQQGEQDGIIQSWMSQDEGIAIVLALMVFNQYEHQYSPQLMTSLLMNYCRDDVADAFVEFFCQLSAQSGITISAAELRKRQFDVLIDIRQFAITGKTLGYKPSWGPFREPHASDWRSGFTSDTTTGGGTNVADSSAAASADEPNIRADRYYIAQSKVTCWKCHKHSRVIAFILPAGSEILESYDDGGDQWVESDNELTICFVELISKAVKERAQYYSPYFTFDFSKTAQQEYWMNHCEHCNAKLGDWPMHNEPGGAFSPQDPGQAASIILFPVYERFLGRYGTISWSLLFEEMRVI